MLGKITVAAIQLQAHDRHDFPLIWPIMVSRVREAAARGAKLVVLPEGSLPAYVLGYRPFNESEVAPAIDALQAEAAGLGVVIVVGTARTKAGSVWNSALVIDSDGTVAGAVDKHFLWHFDRQWFAPGERLEPVQTSLGSIGALICADGRIPTISRTLVDRGAQILVMPTAWVTSGRDPANLENIQADLLARLRARENDVPFVAANKCGVELDCVAYCGKSQIVNASGSIAALASQDEAQTIVAEIEMRPPNPIRSNSVQLSPVVPATPSRIALTFRRRRDSDDEVLKIIEADELISADTLPAVNDEAMCDPGAVPGARLRGIDCVVWKSTCEPKWQMLFARGRALELRMYVIVIDERRNRAYAVDPEGTILCGTYDGYEVAAFSYDPARAAQTVVAPGTDVKAGLERAAQHAVS